MSMQMRGDAAVVCVVGVKGLNTRSRCWEEGGISSGEIAREDDMRNHSSSRRKGCKRGCGFACERG